MTSEEKEKEIRKVFADQCIQEFIDTIDRDFLKTVESHFAAGGNTEQLLEWMNSLIQSNK